MISWTVAHQAPLSLGFPRQEKELRWKWQLTPVLLPGKSHGRRSVVGYSPWGCKESDTTEWFHFHFLQRIFLTQRFNLCLLHWQVDSLLLSHQGSPYRTIPQLKKNKKDHIIKTSKTFEHISQKRQMPNKHTKVLSKLLDIGKCKLKSDEMPVWIH